MARICSACCDERLNAYREQQRSNAAIAAESRAEESAANEATNGWSPRDTVELHRSNSVHLVLLVVVTVYTIVTQVFDEGQPII